MYTVSGECTVFPEVVSFPDPLPAAKMAAGSGSGNETIPEGIVHDLETKVETFLKWRPGCWLLLQMALSRCASENHIRYMIECFLAKIACSILICSFCHLSFNLEHTRCL